MSKFPTFSLSLMLSMAFLCLSCADNDSSKPRLERIAKAYCDCISNSKLQELNDKVATNQNLSDEQALALFKELEIEYNTAKECTSSISSNLGKVSQTDMDSLKLKLPSTCPAVAKDAGFLRELLGE